MRGRWKLLGAALVLTLLALPALRPDTDFTGRQRMRCWGDTAYDYCRALERETGTQIFYLPEWTEREDGLLHYRDFEGFEWNRQYFQDVLEELKKMRDAFERYPEGFLREMAKQKEGRRAEIVLCPYTFSGYSRYGRYVHDYTEGEEKVDCVYYTGCGDSQYYSHEMGHMVMTAAALRGGWRAFCSAWDACGDGYVSDYARTSRPEDWAETWAWLWHQPGAVEAQCRESGALRKKVLCMAELLEENYSAVSGPGLPWTQILERSAEDGDDMVPTAAKSPMGSLQHSGVLPQFPSFFKGSPGESGGDEMEQGGRCL